MRFITVSGPASVGKTSVITWMINALHMEERACVIQFECTSSTDNDFYTKHGIQAKNGFAKDLCPDHFYASNIQECARWGMDKGFKLLIAESVGLCNRCAPHIRGIMAVCVIDCLSGIDTPRKIGPMLRLADIVVLTKGDIVSPAEREVFAFRVRQMNRQAVVLFVNGITGQGADDLGKLILSTPPCDTGMEWRLRTSLPRAVCSYCFGQTGIGEYYQRGEVRKMQFTPNKK